MNRIGISFSFLHIFNTFFLLWLVISSLICTDIVNCLVQWEFSLKMLNKNMAVCMHSSLLGCVSAQMVVPCLSPLYFATVSTSPLLSLSWSLNENGSFMAVCVSVLSLVTHLLGADHEQSHCIYFPSYTSTKVASLLKPFPLYKMARGPPSANQDSAIALWCSPNLLQEKTKRHHTFYDSMILPFHLPMIFFSEG